MSTYQQSISSSEKTTNIINSIMPFDTKNCVRYNANYLRGYTSEKRDVDVNNVRPLVATQAQDIARIAANETLVKTMSLKAPRIGYPKKFKT